MLQSLAGNMVSKRVQHARGGKGSKACDVVFGHGLLSFLVSIFKRGPVSER